MWAFCILRSRGVHPSITLSTKLRRNSIRWTPNRHTRYKSANPTWRVKYASVARYDDMPIFVLRGPQARRHLAHHDGQTKRGLQCAAMLNTLPRRRSHKNRRHFAANPDKCVKDLRRRLVLTVVLGIVDRWLAYCQYIKPHINSTASTFDKNKMSAGGPTKHRTGPHWHTGPTKDIYNFFGSNALQPDPQNGPKSSPVFPDRSMGIGMVTVVLGRPCRHVPSHVA